MKTLDNHTLLYDEECPMCNMYTSTFIKANMLDNQGRKPFVNITTEEENYIDLERAKNEIALVDKVNQKVYYGIDSLLKVIGNSFPWMEKIGNWKPINYFLKKLYKFISYNRKVIVPSKTKAEHKINCIPDFNTKYRLFYIAFATLFTALVLFQYAELIVFLPKGTFVRELLLAVGQIGFQAIFTQKLDKQKQLNYIGNLVTVSIIGSLLLLPILILNSYFDLNDYFILGWFGLTVNFMIYEHYRRISLLELPKYLTLTWILYRIIALVIIINL
ncbi:putative DCC family thiol-disulfide oxidoreductase YuxK [Flavobacterium sp. 28A]|uniref:DCC1-like thiol-disulfide oxidoreductase family protein n=1 Tax=Flavobacterium sp. 28A TaxID=2735895 RepID=UPI00156E9B33|nr:DCC1-like thiol-disulfide oxidoreductase family protein [Flavobacterium sp. 28A]NRT15018.1 putative DCC family thiol-disulfide oxidoreductase YuxK [Flavobacterium sp. 28A]